MGLATLRASGEGAAVVDNVQDPPRLAKSPPRDTGRECVKWRTSPLRSSTMYDEHDLIYSPLQQTYSAGGRQVKIHIRMTSTTRARRQRMATSSKSFPSRSSATASHPPGGPRQGADRLQSAKSRRSRTASAFVTKHEPPISARTRGEACRHGALVEQLEGCFEGGARAWFELLVHRRRRRAFARVGCAPWL